MKKILSIFLISSTISFSTTNIISCKESREKQDISQKEFMPISASDGIEAYLAVRTQIARWASPEITSTQVKEDQHIGIILYDMQNVLIPETAKEIIIQPYQAEINVDSQDIYFIQMAAKRYDLTPANDLLFKILIN